LDKYEKRVLYFILILLFITLMSRVVHERLEHPWFGSMRLVKLLGDSAESPR